MRQKNSPTTPTPHYEYDPILRKCTIRGVRELPAEIFEIADKIEILDASFGHLTSLPDNLGDVKNLRIGFFSHNDFESVPEVLSACDKLEMVGFKSCKIRQLSDHALPQGLRGLILTDNRLTGLPKTIGTYAQLQKLMLTGNQLKSLSDALLGCVNLELLRLSVNYLEKEPSWISQLPHLAWYSDSGNPFHAIHTRQGLQGFHALHTANATNTATAASATADTTGTTGARPVIPEIPWQHLIIEDKIGESAKNVVYQGYLAMEPVAIKLFGKGVTTDGNPIDDMYASLLAGIHPNIIGAIGRITDAPDGQEGLVIPLISPSFKPLGLPPDFRTLTRDVYPDSTAFQIPFILQVARDVATAMRHLASRGIMHGDIYAHNILTNSTGQSIIGDFGAASLSGYTPHAAKSRHVENNKNNKLGVTPSKWREQIDVRGFGYLLDDLLAVHSRMSSQISTSISASSDDSNSSTGGAALKTLQTLRDACLDKTPNRRPSFADIYRQLMRTTV